MKLTKYYCFLGFSMQYGRSLVTFLLILKMEVTHPSETSVMICQTTQRYIPEDITLIVKTTDLESS